MKLEAHQEIYRLALEAACSELGEITAQFEKLRIRKEQVERLITVLKPVIGEEEKPSAIALVEQQSGTVERVEPVEEPVAVAVAQPLKHENVQPLGVGADPFQRRIDHVLGIGAGIRDVRQYTRQF
jgi:hypothetical protein